MNETNANEKDTNDEILRNNSEYHTQSSLAKDLITGAQTKNEKLVHNFNNRLICLRNAIIIKQILEN